MTWQVDGRTKTGGGRRYFPTEAEAKTYAEGIKIKRENEGVSAFSMDAASRSDADAALAILKPRGVTLVEAARFYTKSVPVAEGDKTVDETIPEFLKAKTKDGLAPRYLSDLKSRLDIFSASHGSSKLTEISTSMLDDWLRGRAGGPTNRNNHRRVLSVFFGFAKRRGYLVVNPATSAARAKEIDKLPGILTVKESKTLLAHSPKAIIPAVALGLFAGLRPESEIWRLDWVNIDFDSNLIDIAAGKTKTGQNRFVKIQPNLRKWLLPFRKGAGPVGPMGDEYYKVLQGARKAADILTWPGDCLRHTFASMHLAHFKNQAETATELGHMGLAMLYRHYRERVKPAEAALFWKIRP